MEVDFDIIVIGAGPHALSFMSRILLDVDNKYDERQDNTRLFVKNKSGKYHAKVRDNPQTLRTPRQISSYLKSGCKINKDLLSKICVIDKYGDWMTQWSKQFDALGISHLRSTSSVHPDAFDLQTMVKFAEDAHRELELLEIDGKIRGSKFTGPFIVPTTGLFWDFCKSVVKRHKLQNFVTKGLVKMLLPIKTPFLHYQLHLDTGQIVTAKYIVVATGNIGVKHIPEWAFETYNTCNDGSLLHTADMINNSTAHGINAHQSNVNKLKNQLNELNLSSGTFDSKNNIDNNCVLIVGGGLSSAHLAVKAAMQDANQIHLVCRSGIKIRQFDLDLEWIGRSRFIKLAGFYSINSFKDRAGILRSSRGGGSITPSVHQHLKLLQNSGKLIIHDDTEVWSCEQDVRDLSQWKVQLSDGHVVNSNHVWLATGSTVDVTKNPLFSDVITVLPIDIVEGLPVLTEDLEWGFETGLFVMGSLGGLRLGPDALNLAGARGGASRVAHCLKARVK